MTGKTIVGMTVMTLTLITGLLTTFSCTTGNKQQKVVIHLERKNLAQSSLLVFNFHEPHHAGGLGAYTAERFHLNLLEAKKFLTVGLFNDSPWNRLGKTEEERLLFALEQGREKKFDYILVGEITDSFNGVLNESRLAIKVRIIEVDSQITIFLAENHKENQGKDPSYPMTTKLSQRSQPPKMLAEKIIKELIKAI
jgi:phenylpyruvate tautomerase PptA (4-oxalocrotonate tautomerase family)